MEWLCSHGAPESHPLLLQPHVEGAFYPTSHLSPSISRRSQAMSSLLHDTRLGSPGATPPPSCLPCSAASIVLSQPRSTAPVSPPSRSPPPATFRWGPPFAHSSGPPPYIFALDSRCYPQIISCLQTACVIVCGDRGGPAGQPWVSTIHT